MPVYFFPDTPYFALQSRARDAASFGVSLSAALLGQEPPIYPQQSMRERMEQLPNPCET